MVRCAAPHTSQTYAVGQLRTTVDGHLVAVDSERVRQQVARVCPRKLAGFLGAPDEALLTQMLVKHFRDRQLSVDPEVIEFLVNRIERSAAAAERVVAALDAAALGQRRRVTIRLARELFAASPTSDA